VAIVEKNSELGQQIVADAKQYVLHSWSVQDAVNPIPVAGGEGRYFWDYDGKRYLDFASQLVNLSLGHQHPKLIQAIKEQAEQLCTIGPPMASKPRSTLARLLARSRPATYRCRSSRTAAPGDENAIKLARWYTGRDKVIARYRSYHGATAERSRLQATRAAGPRSRHAGRAAHVRPVRIAAPQATGSCPVCTAHRTSRRFSSTKARRRLPP
jgi:taurine--2-oxoglutarate transaminase